MLNIIKGITSIPAAVVMEFDKQPTSNRRVVGDSRSS